MFLNLIQVCCQILRIIFTLIKFGFFHKHTKLASVVLVPTTTLQVNRLHMCFVGESLAVYLLCRGVMCYIKSICWAFVVWDSVWLGVNFCTKYTQLAAIFLCVPITIQLNWPKISQLFYYRLSKTYCEALQGTVVSGNYQIPHRIFLT